MLELPAEPRRAELEPIRALVHATLERQPLLAGAGMVFAPGVLADAPRWLEWWRSVPAGAPVLLDASLDPGDPDFYDYEAAEWFTTPRDTGERWIAGPFVDHSGTNEHILTLTLPVVRAGAFLGVAGADIAVGAIEAVGGAALGAVDGRGRARQPPRPDHRHEHAAPAGRDAVGAGRPRRGRRRPAAAVARDDRRLKYGLPHLASGAPRGGTASPTPAQWEPPPHLG